jgi:hypothetical protein
MNPNQLLNRIFSLSRRLPDSRPNEIPFGFETAVLAHWRDASAQRATSAGLLRGLRWAALVACAVAILTAVLESDELAAFRNRSDPATRVADSALSASYGNE